MKKICHLTSVHQLFDIRIFHKECKTLVQHGYDVISIGPYNQDGNIDGVQMKALSMAKNRLNRMTQISWKVFILGKRENADLYHFHDPELIPIGLLFKILGKKVIYDVHEDYPRAILTKEWIPHSIRGIVSGLFSLGEWVGVKFFDGIIPATPAIARRFPSFKTITVQNFPFLDEIILYSSTPYQERESVVAYIGAVSALRGAKEMVQAMALLPAHLEIKLKLAGIFSPLDLEEEIKKYSGWDRVDFLGWQSHKDIMTMLGKARIGLVVLHPAPNHIKSQPNKLFEYMSAGLPVVASDFPLWREIIEDAGCGLLVDPFDPKAIAKAIRWLLEHPSEAERMGKQGQKAVFEHYNWEGEAKKLLTLYNNILDKR